MGAINVGAAAEAAKREDKGKQNPFLRIFTAWSFKLPTKRSVFTNDDKSETEKLAYVTFKVGGMESFTMRASIYESRKLNGDCELYLAMPTSGKGFPQPIFSAEDSQTQVHYDAFKLHIAQAYETWEAALKAEGKATGAVAGGASRIVRHRPKVDATTPTTPTA